jgi:membrane protein
LVISIGFLLLVSLVASPALTAFGTWYGAWFPGWVITLQIINQLVSLAFVTVLFAMMYRILPSVHVGWQDVWLGAFVTVLFTIGKFLIGLYLGKAGVTSGFGAAGSVVVLLVWVFYSAQIFPLGAEFSWVYAQSHGSRAQTALAEPQGQPVAPAHRAGAAGPTTARRNRPVAEALVGVAVWLGLG